MSPVALCSNASNGSDGRKAMGAFESFFGRKADGVVDFVAFDSWKSFDNDAAWGIGGWKGSGYKLAESVPLTVTGTSLADIAAGKQDAHFTKLAQTLVDNGFPDAYVRLGWEFNGGWYPWAAQKDPISFAAAWRHVATVLKSTPGQHFLLVWNPSLGTGANPPQTLWPGDDVVDLIGIDFYNQSWRPQDKDPAAHRLPHNPSTRSQMQLRRLMYEKGYLAALTASIADIDVTVTCHWPFTRFACN